MDNFIFCAVRLLKFPLLKAGSRGAHENWFLNIFKSMFSLQLSIRLSLLWIISSFFFQVAVSQAHATAIVMLFSTKEASEVSN